MVLSSRNGPGETAHVQLLQRSKSYIVPTTSSTSNNTTGGSSMNSATNNCNNNRNSILEGIHLSNLQDGETLSYGLALVRGRVPATCKRLRVRCLGSSSSSSVNNSNNGLTQQQQQSGVKQTSQHQWAEWPCVNGDFRLLVELQRGHNRVELEAAGHRRKFGLVYEPRYTRLRVTPVYVICAGHDGYFQGPQNENRSPESAATRIGLGARLLQTLTAEKLHEAGHGRKTFQLERDLDGPECLVMHSQLHVDRARAMTQRELWELVGRELMQGPLASKDRKYLAFLSCTRYCGAPSPRTHEDTLARTQAHAALGGGGLALFGSACLHTWPTCMAQVLPRFLDTRAIDTEQLMDDSNYRGTHGGCLATTLGSALHELGHTFDLGHTRDGIMGRGFDFVDRVFLGAAGLDTNRNSVRRQQPQHTTVALSRPLSVTVVVAPSPSRQSRPRSRLLSESSTTSTSGGSRPVSLNFDQSEGQRQPGQQQSAGRLSAPASPELNRSFAKSVQAANPVQTDRTYWGSSCAAMLAYHRWFNSDLDNGRQKNLNDLKYDAKRNVVRSRHGVRVIELRESAGGLVVASRQFSGSHLTVEAMVPAPPPHHVQALTLVAEDSLGSILKYPLPTAF
ncbi:uncharacterized protein LOC106654673 [Trichogramma pretiosum]|uniref:uncharacterized protein LOC106654673 n=1 Tax=Trichogramma pretiosum TaxID=7493 RepID=UPI0006C99E1D|nr:uncharacterized protein LOC106654673 [Trichogramma pretiosum]